MKNKKMLAKAGLVIGLLLSSNVAMARDVMLGKTILTSAGGKSAEIPIAVCKRVNDVRIEARRDLFLARVILKYQNGESQTLEFNRKLKADSYTSWRPINLTGRERCVTHVEVRGTSHGSTAGVTVHDRR